MAGVLVLVQAIGDALTLTLNMNIQALAFAIIIGLLLSYVGLLGLYPRLADQTPQLARAGLVLVLIPVLLLIVLAVALLVSSEPPFSESVGEVLFLAVFVGFALGIVLFSVATFQSQLLSRAVGISLLGFAAGWFVLLGGSLIYGFPMPDWLTFVADGIMAVSLLTIGILLYTDATPHERAEPTDAVS